MYYVNIFKSKAENISNKVAYFKGAKRFDLLKKRISLKYNRLKLS